MSPRMGLLRGIGEGVPGGIWDSYWWFKGPSAYGGDNGHLWMPDNADFEYKSIAGGMVVGTILVGAEAGGTIWNSNRYSTMFSKDNYPDSLGSWKLSLNYDASYPDTNSRRVWLHTWRPYWSAQGGYAEHFKYPFEKTLFGGRFYSEADWSFCDIVDSTQQIHTYTYRNGNGTIDSTSRVRIGAAGWYTGPNYTTTEFTGKIYWVLWIQGYLATGQDMYDIYDGTKQPNEICDSATFPMCYINFKDPVGATLTPDVQSGPNAPYTFNVYGTPVLNGP